MQFVPRPACVSHLHTAKNEQNPSLASRSFTEVGGFICYSRRWPRPRATRDHPELEIPRSFEGSTTTGDGTAKFGPGPVDLNPPGTGLVGSFSTTTAVRPLYHVVPRNQVLFPTEVQGAGQNGSCFWGVLALPRAQRLL